MRLWFLSVLAMALVLSPNGCTSVSPPAQPTCQFTETKIAVLPDRFGPVLFSPDSKSMAFVSRRGTQYFVVVNGKAGPEYDLIDIQSLKFSPDGKRVAFKAWRGTKMFMVVDGQTGPEFDFVCDLIFSPDSQRLAYKAQMGTQRFMVVDGKPVSEFEVAGDPTFSPDSKRLAVEASIGIQKIMVVDGQAGPAYDRNFPFPNLQPQQQTDRVFG